MEVTKPQIQQVKQCRFEQIYAYLPFFYALCTLCPFFYCIDLFPVIGSIRFEQFCFSAGEDVFSGGNARGGKGPNILN